MKIFTKCLCHRVFESLKPKIRINLHILVFYVCWVIFSIHISVQHCCSRFVLYLLCHFCVGLLRIIYSFGIYLVQGIEVSCQQDFGTPDARYVYIRLISYARIKIRCKAKSNEKMKSNRNRNSEKRCTKNDRGNICLEQRNLNVSDSSTSYKQ